MIRVPEDQLRSVVFLTVDEHRDGQVLRRPRATGFLVTVPVRHDVRMSYVVTARHCLEEARSYGNLYIRMNLKAGGVIELPTNPNDWLTHDSADVAVILALAKQLPQGISHTDIDHSSIMVESFVGGPPDYTYEGDIPLVGRHRIRPETGYQTYFLGLFTQHSGGERNLPIARFGHISRMPTEIAMTDSDGRGFKEVAYLMEFQAWGGNSGAPVFFLSPLVLQDEVSANDGTSLVTGVDLAWVSGLLGVVNAHYPSPQKARTQGDILGEVETDLNSGIAVVTPIEAVRQLLMREDLMNDRQARLRKLEHDEPKPILDFATGQDVLTREAFEATLRNVSRRIMPSEPDQAPSETSE